MSYILVLAATSIDFSTESDCLDTQRGSWAKSVESGDPSNYLRHRFGAGWSLMTKSKQQPLQIVVHGMYVDTALLSVLKYLCPHTYCWDTVDWTTNSSSLKLFSKIFRQSAYFPVLKSLSLTVEGLDYYGVEHMASGAPSRMVAFHIPVDQCIEVFRETPPLQDV
ncbi:hypothetical protein DFS33DRAFT_1059354 [Desarmillaria ectypa]|nr:hypothetical protein DFS33DRAFT_1059354 [Desarmillaria ectypa]